MRASWRLIWLCFFSVIYSQSLPISSSSHHHHRYHQGRPHHLHDLKITCLWSANSTSHKMICFNTCLWIGTGLLQGTGLFANFYGSSLTRVNWIRQRDWAHVKERCSIWQQMDNITTQQIYNHWMNAVSSCWKLNAVEFTSAQQHIAGTPGACKVTFNRV